MVVKTNKTLGLSEFINQVKKDLLAEQEEKKPYLFFIDEVNLEVNFTVSGDIESGFNFGVVTLGSNVSEDRTQKVSIKMSPLVTKKQVIEEINKSGFESGIVGEVVFGSGLIKIKSMFSGKEVILD